jgi:hypothetical protein
MDLQQSSGNSTVSSDGTEHQTGPELQWSFHLTALA